MATIEMPQTDTDGLVDVGPTDREVIAVLQRMASARAHLTHAERQAREQRGAAAAEARNRGIEDAHAEVIWAQAGVVCTRRQGKALKDLQMAEYREREVLKRHGFATFREYLAERHARPTNDTHLTLARREFEAAQECWEALQAAFAPTVIIDLTGDEPRVIN